LARDMLGTGSANYMGVQNPPAPLGVTMNFTISLHLDVRSHEDNPIITRWQFGWIMQMYGGGKLQQYNGAWVESAVGGMPLGKHHLLHHVAGASSKALTDGVQVLAGNTGGGQGGGHLFFGARDDIATRFNGGMCEVAIWNVLLTDAEHRALRRGVSPLVVRPLNLVGYWPFWGTTPVATGEPDLSRTKAHINIHNGATKVQHFAGSPLAL